MKETASPKQTKSEKMEEEADKPIEAPDDTEANEVLNSSKESEDDAKEEDTDSIHPEKPEIIKETVEPKIEYDEKVDDEGLGREPESETLAVASSVMDMILNNSEAKLAGKEDKTLDKDALNTAVKASNNSVALSIGSKVEAKDFGEYWHPAEIIEVDYEEMEVLVHYEDVTKKLDEWISVSSPRLRPMGSGSPSAPAPVAEPSTSADADRSTVTPTPVLKEEVKVEEKPKIAFTVGERCLARWRDNRRFIATVNADMGEGKFEIIFDDGVKWTCGVTRLSKLKEAGKDPLTIDTTGVSASPSTPSPVYGPGPSNAGVIPTPPLPAYNTHLFDPTRDYLGSKSERREMKRKLNIKEIFNIGQKKKKVETPKVVKEKPLILNVVQEKTPTPKVVMEKTPTPKLVKEKTPTPKLVKEKTSTPKVVMEKTPILKVVKEKTPTPKLVKEKTPTPKLLKEKTPTSKVVKEKTATPKVVREKTPTPKVVKERTPTPKVVKEKKPKVNKKVKEEPAEEVTPIKKEIPDAVASIIGTVTKESPTPEPEDEVKTETEVTVISLDDKMDIDDSTEVSNSDTFSTSESHPKSEVADPVVKEEIKLEKFEKEDELKHVEELYRIKEAIIKLEDDLKQPEIKIEIDKFEVDEPNEEDQVVSEETSPKPEKKKDLSKIKKVKKVRLLQEKKVKKQVAKVKSELEKMKKQVVEMRKKMSEELSKSNQCSEMPESFLLPGEWCCKWVNGQPVGTVSEIEHEKSDNIKTVLPRRSVQVDDKRLPAGWTKHMIRRSFGNSAGKWDVVMMTPDNRRIHTKTDMKHYLDANLNEALKPYESALMDFGIHLKLSRRMGWYTTTPSGEQQVPDETLSANSPLLVKRKKLSLKKNKLKDRNRPKLRMKLKVPKGYRYEPVYPADQSVAPSTSIGVPLDELLATGDAPPDDSPLEDGFVYVGSLKVQVIENLLRCPAEACFKNFRNNTLLKMHIKHYHRELRKMLGTTPKVLDLAYARQRPTQGEMRRLKLEAQHKTIRVKIPKMPRKIFEPKPEKKETVTEPKLEQTTPVKTEVEKVPRSQDSPKLRNALSTKPAKRPKVLLPVRKTELPDPTPEIKLEEETDDLNTEIKVEDPTLDEALDFETAISTHTVTKPLSNERRKGDKKKKTFASIQKRPLTASEDEDWLGVNSDMETRSSYPRSGTPDSKVDQKLMSSESNEEQKDNNYLFTESGERIKIVHMKREEIINCHCGFREEDGLMVQCELCLCWQHALCHNIQKESDVPEKYTCSICLNPRRGRRSQRFLHDQDRLYEGLLPGAKPCESLRRSHELSGNLHRIEDALHALRVKYHVATKKDHPKLYLWAKDWEAGELSLTQEKLNSDYSDLNIMISNIGKENLPVKHEDMKDMPLDIRTPSSEDTDGDRFSQKDNQLGSQALLSGLLSSPGGASLDLPISTSELERLAKTVQAEQEAQRVVAPQPEAAIENSACRERLLRHIQRCQALIDARLDSIEAQVAELESQDPSFEDDETADYFPRTKQTIQMMMRDLDTMEELGVIT